MTPERIDSITFSAFNISGCQRWAHSRVPGASAERRFPNRLIVSYCRKVSAKPSARSKPVWKPALRQGLANAPEVNAGQAVASGVTKHSVAEHVEYAVSIRT